MKKRLQTGFAHLGLLLLLLVIVVIALIGYKVVKDRNNTPVSSTSGTVATQQIQTIKTKADLNTAESTLNNENVDGDLNPDSLNQDVSSLL